MARDRANINTAIWTSDEFRCLTRPQMGLYFMLVSHPKLNYVGVADWRVARLAAIAEGDTPSGLRGDAQALQDARFIFMDDDTEEVLVRSFMRHDGLLKQPKLSISMVNAYGEIASKKIREIVTFELQRLHSEHPDWAAFRQEKVMSLVKGKGSDMATFTHGESTALPIAGASVDPSFTLNAGQADPLRTTTATTTATEASLPGEETKKKPETKIPKNWAPTAEHIKRAADKNVNVLEQAEAFRLHAETHDRRAASWNAAFTTWLIKAKPGTAQQGFNPNDWMNR